MTVTTALTPLPCRILPHRSADGTTNMATDESMLDFVQADPSSAIFRTYEWSEPTLSLGYFQGFARAEAEPRWRSVAIVRRPTGGGALWHDREITYAIALPAGHPLAARGLELYQTVHAAIASLIRGDGTDAHRRGEADAATPGTPKALLCFADRDAEDVVSGQAKVVGSAQRRRRRATLQHGAILLARSPTAPEFPGIADLGLHPRDAPAWAALLRTAIPEALGLVPSDDDLTAGETEAIARLGREVYADPAWTRRR